MDKVCQKTNFIEMESSIKENTGGRSKSGRENKGRQQLEKRSSVNRMMILIYWVGGWDGGS
jgi:hypothetical protein